MIERQVFETVLHVWETDYIVFRDVFAVHERLEKECNQASHDSFGSYDTMLRHGMLRAEECQDNIGFWRAAKGLSKSGADI
jgi:hypothetical protein